MKKLDSMIENTMLAKQNYESALGEFTLDFFMENFSYKQKDILVEYQEKVKDLGEYKICNRISNAISKMKELEYPEVNGVKYYREQIEKLTVTLTESQKIELDRALFRNSRPGIIYGSLAGAVPSDKEHDVLKELFDLGVIAPAIEVMCNCGGMAKIGNVHKGQTLQGFCNLDDSDDMEQVSEALYYRINCNECWGDQMDDVDSMIEEAIEKIKNPRTFFRFSVIAKPDMTIDNL